VIFNELIALLKSYEGLENIERLSPGGPYLMRFAKNEVLEFWPDPLNPKNPDLWVLLGKIVPFPDKQQKGDLFLAMLRANMMGQGTNGAIIAADRKKKQIYLSRTFALSRLNTRLAMVAFEDFLNQIYSWRIAIPKGDYYWPFVKDTLGNLPIIGPDWKKI
jgi:hypothetical protein